MKGKGMMLALAAAMLGMSGSAEAMPQARDAAPAVAAPMTAAAAYGQRDWRDNRDRGDVRGDRRDWRGDRGDMRGERRGWDRRHRGWDRGYGYGRYRSCWNVRRYGRWERVCRWRRR